MSLSKHQQDKRLSRLQRQLRCFYSITGLLQQEICWNNRHNWRHDVFVELWHLRQCLSDKRDGRWSKMIVKICSLFLSRQLTVGTKFHNIRPRSVAENNPLHTMLLTSTNATSGESTRSATIFTSSTLTGEEMQDLLAFQALLRKEDELMKYTRSKQKQDEMRSKHDSTYNRS